MIWPSCNYTELVYEIHPPVACSYFPGASDLQFSISWPFYFNCPFVPMSAFPFYGERLWETVCFKLNHTRWVCCSSVYWMTVISLWLLKITCSVTSSNLLSHSDLIACLCLQVLYTSASRYATVMISFFPISLQFFTCFTD